MATVLAQLLKAEIAEREVRSTAYQLKVARFPAYRDLAGFDFASSEISEALVRQLHRGTFIDVAERALRCVPLGRKSWLFCGSDRGGQRAAVMYTLIGSCRLNPGSRS